MAIEIEDIEVLLLTEAVYQRWGYDFRDYAPTSLKRRIRRCDELEKLLSISSLQEKILRDSDCMQRFLDQVSVNVTSMFRDPGLYRAFRATVVPLLKEQPSLRIWHAGCASGEEVYSIAILLHEEDLLGRTRIYATDLDQAVLERAKEGIYGLGLMKGYTENYQAAGGKAAFSEYYHAGHGHVVMRKDLSKNIVWARHNLVTDASFNEFNLILCRNVLIYFNARLQERAHRLFYQSLAEGGVLVLGRQETMRLTPHESHYRTLDGREKIFQRMI
ncbi:MAG: protein-glutamate O-methyltransferase CheR [Candidatus Planktophila sp.]|nr:protein-glutamate O-methyltransferase CheR [Candidatus Planktophila sp.]